MNPLMLQRVRAVQDEVRAHFGWSIEDDEFSALKLEKEMSEHCPFGVENWSTENRRDALQRLRCRIQSASMITFVGAAVERHQLVATPEVDGEYIVADGAVGACFDRIEPLCVVSDFDGVPYLDEAAIRGIPLILHAHGDNITAWNEKLTQWSKLQQPPDIILTHQTPLHLNEMFNVGGFTDGDRAVCFAQWCGATPDRVTFLGYTTTKVGKWSGHTTPHRKLEKLEWMERILNFFPVMYEKYEYSKVEEV
jgi:uncharacterized Rossmann fold enzyme